MSTKTTYPKVVLWAGDKKVWVYVHALVAEAFIGPRPDGLEINHKDAIDNGLRVPTCGERIGCAKLTTEQVREIRELAATQTYPEIARKFGIESARVSRICRGLLWPTAPGPIYGQSVGMEIINMPWRFQMSLSSMSKPRSGERDWRW